MEPYVLTIMLICVLGFLVVIARQNAWSGQMLIGKRKYTASVETVLWLMILLAFLLFGGLRYQVGTDFDSYCTIFTNICADWYDVLYDGTERGYVWLNRLVSLFTDDPQWMIFVTNGFISFFGVWCIRRYSKFPPLSLYLFFTTIYYQGFNLIRQGMACALVFLAFGFARDRKWIKCYGLLIIASLFHRTALVVIPIIFLMHFTYRPVWYFLFAAVSCLGFLLQGPINDFLLQIYPTAAQASSAYLYEEFSPVQVVLCGIYLFLCLRYYNQLLEKNKGNILYINFSILLFGLYTCFYWIPMWGRLQLYFICIYALIVPEVVSCEKNRMLRILYYAVIWGILLFFFIVPNLVGGSGLWTYQTIFSR